MLVPLIAVAMLSLYSQRPRCCVTTPGCYDYATHDSVITDTPFKVPGGNCHTFHWLLCTCNVVSNRDAPVKNQGIHRIISCQPMYQTDLNLNIGQLCEKVVRTTTNQN